MSKTHETWRTRTNAMSNRPSSKVIHLAVADLLRQRRLELGLSCRQASEKAGIDGSHYWNIEHGKNDMHLSTLVKVLAALDLELHLKKRKST